MDPSCNDLTFLHLRMKFFHFKSSPNKEAEYTGLL